MDYKDKYERQLTLYKQAQDIIDEYIDIIDEMASDMTQFKFSPYNSTKDFSRIFCNHIKDGCLLDNCGKLDACKKCLKRYYAKKIREKRESDKTGKIITYNDLKHPVKVFLNGKYFGDTEEYETLIYDFFALDKSKYQELHFTNIRVDEDFYGATDEEKELVMDWLNYTLEIDDTQARLIEKKNWYALYKLLGGKT